MPITPGDRPHAQAFAQVHSQGTGGPGAGAVHAQRATGAPKLGPFHAVIEQILADDEHAPPKQRHTAMQIYRRLRGPEHGYTGGYDQVRRYVGRHRDDARQTFVPLVHPVRLC